MPDRPLTSPTLSLDEELALVDELAAALEEMVDRTCFEMAPLWVEATREARVCLGGALSELGFLPSQRYVSLWKGARRRYRGLAAWRHAVLWRRVDRAVVDDDFRAALDAVYFTPFPDNVPPYAWSGSAAGVPGAERFGSPTSLKHHAKEAAWLTVAALRAERQRLRCGAWKDELRAELLKPATRDSLRDVLKLEDHDAWEEEG